MAQTQKHRRSHDAPTRVSVCHGLPAHLLQRRRNRTNPGELRICHLYGTFSLRDTGAFPEHAQEKGDETNEDLGDCPNNGGKQIFPGKLSPDEGAADALSRRKVKLVATLSPRIEGVNVYFRVFDVDDPFDQIHGPNGSATALANVGLIDSTPVVGNDNRDTSTTLGFFGPVPSQPDGTTSITLTVSMQPGDNYRAAASVIPEAVREPTQGGQLDQPDADNA